MMRVRWGVGMACVGLGVLAGSASGQWAEVERGWCDDDWNGRDGRARSCVVYEADFDDPGALSLDGRMNGGVSVEGWERDFVSVRAKVWSHAEGEARAEELLGEVRLSMRSGALTADGPDTRRRESWGVSWEVMVPRSTDLEIETMNGGIAIADVDGRIDFRALNGGVSLERVSGDVEGRTTNGGVRVVLDGRRWDGRGLDVETTNGGVSVVIPEGYSADLVTGTVNGGFDLDFPVTVQGRLGRRLETTLGEGGPRIRAVTTNGGVKLERGRSAVR